MGAHRSGFSLGALRGRPFARDISILNNRFEGSFDPSNGYPDPGNASIHGGVTMVEVDGVRIINNSWPERPATADNVCECCRCGNVSVGFPNGRCLNITITDVPAPPAPPVPPPPLVPPLPPGTLPPPQLLAAHQYTVNFEWLANHSDRAYVDKMPFHGITIRFKNATKGGPQSVHSNYSVDEAQGCVFFPG
jgi:hypothetical protein